MKTIYKHIALMIGTAFFGAVTVNAQTMSGFIQTQPCNNNGQINVSVTGLTPPISYTCSSFWGGITVVHSAMPSATDNFPNLPGYFYQPWQNPNVWIVAASDGTNSTSLSFTLTPAFNATTQVTPALCPALSTVQAFFSGGVSPFVCVWTNTSTTLSYTGNPVQASNGSYTMEATDAAGCKVRSATGFSANITIWSTPSFNVNMAGSVANCTNGTASVTSISGGVAPYTYLWNNFAVASNISGLTMGSYNCAVTDATGCQSTGYYFVSQAVTINFNASVTNATCLQNNGSALGFVTGGTSPYTFFWTNGASTQNITGLTAGPYMCQVTDANGCIGSGWANVSATTPISVVTSAVPSACTLATGGATAVPSGGAAPYTYIWYTFPSVVTTAGISGRSPGTYSFKVTDVNGCIRTGAAQIPQISTITGGISGLNVMCPATTGVIYASAVGSNPPFSYLWSNTATTATLTGVPLGYYTCVITDAAGCSVTKGHNLGQYSPVTMGYSTSPASCIFAADGSALANATGGTAPYTYVWSNSQTGPTATGLSKGSYFALATDANGCTNTNFAYAYVSYNAANNSCYCTITGTVYNDVNVNCVKNVGENGLLNTAVHCTGFGYEYTNSNGVYSFKVPSGTYTFSESVKPYYPLAGCQGNSSVVTVAAGSGCQSIVNFANVITPVNDLRIATFNNWAPPIPGFVYQQRIMVTNDGTNSQSTVQLRYKHDGQLSYLNSSPLTMVQQNSSAPTWYSILTGFPTLAAGASAVSYVNYAVAANVPLGTQVVFMDTVARQAPVGTNWLSDVTPWNNVNYFPATVVGSWDPNYKEVSPKGTGPTGLISKNDSILTYVVHFQNLGNYYAQDVEVLDTLDPNLNIGSLHPGYSTFKYTTSISETGVAKFRFDNINLPWKEAFGDEGSSGMFSYTIRMKKNLALGTQIKNKAAIYFDFNPPVITNITLNTIGESTVTTSISEFKKEGINKMVLYPNPASNYFDLLYESEEEMSGTMTLFDLSGREVTNSKVEIRSGSNTLRTNSDQLQNGIYLVQLKAENSTLVGKLIITR